MTSPTAAAARFDRPVILVSTPRAGSTLLFETLRKAPHLFTPGGESHGRIERIAGLYPGERGWDSNRLAAVDATPARIAALAEGFYDDARDRDGRAPAGAIRFLEKTPKNALRIPFFTAAFPDARLIYLYRDPRPTLSSMAEAWSSGRFRTYPQLPGWVGPAWSLLLVPGWRDLNGLPLLEIVAHQWARTTSIMIDDLERLPAERVTVVDHRAFLDRPAEEMARLADRLDLAWDVALGPALPISRTTVSAPDPDKWKRHAAAIEEVMPIVAQADARARAFVARSSA